MPDGYSEWGEMPKVKFKDYKKVYDRFWDDDKRPKPSDIELMLDLIHERTVMPEEPSLKWIFE